MEKYQYKNKQREILANTIQKIKSENGIDLNIGKYSNKKLIIKKPKSKKHHHKRKSLNLNDNLSKEIQDINPKNNKIYEKCKYLLI